MGRCAVRVLVRESKSTRGISTMRNKKCVSVAPLSRRSGPPSAARSPSRGRPLFSPPPPARCPPPWSTTYREAASRTCSSSMAYAARRTRRAVAPRARHRRSSSRPKSARVKESSSTKRGTDRCVSPSPIESRASSCWRTTLSRPLTAPELSSLASCSVERFHGSEQGTLHGTTVYTAFMARSKAPKPPRRGRSAVQSSRPVRHRGPSVSSWSKTSRERAIALEPSAIGDASQLLVWVTLTRAGNMPRRRASRPSSADSVVKDVAIAQPIRDGLQPTHASGARRSLPSCAYVELKSCRSTYTMPPPSRTSGVTSGRIQRSRTRMEGGGGFATSEPSSERALSGSTNGMVCSMRAAPGGQQLGDAGSPMSIFGASRKSANMGHGVA